MLKSSFKQSFQNNKYSTQQTSLKVLKSLVVTGVQSYLVQKFLYALWAWLFPQSLSEWLTFQ
jgi:hypothetical protein